MKWTRPYTYCLPRGNVFNDKRLRVEYEQKRATRCARIPGARGNPERARGTCTIPLSTVRSERRLMREGCGGRPRLSPRRGTDAARTASKDALVAAHGRRKAPSASTSVQYNIQIGRASCRERV